MFRQEAELTSLRDWVTVLIRFAFAAKAEYLDWSRKLHSFKFSCVTHAG